jgi:exodeoxyribonuclease V beta subunit
MNDLNNKKAAFMALEESNPHSQILHPETFPLWGSRLIEASAGTGKTWTIAALYLRMVLGLGGDHGFARPLRPAEILVMTFTRVATRELSDRIRQRLLHAAQCFRGEQAPHAHDEFLKNILAAYAPGPERNQAAWTLAMAAESMDDASVFTIDAWCQRMLKEHAFDSGCLFDEELVADEVAMRTEAIQDYWRQACYPLQPQALASILAIWSDVTALQKDMGKLMDQPIPAEAAQGSLMQVLTAARAHRAARLKELKSGWAERAAAMQAWLDDETTINKKNWKTSSLASRFYTPWLNSLAAWAKEENDDKPDLKKGWERFTLAGMLDVRLPDTPPLSLPPEFAAFAELEAAFNALPAISKPLRLHAAASIALRLQQLKRQSGSFGFSDMLQRLNTALHGVNGTRLRERILAQYPAIMIDEFQDTSPLQYEIFDQVYQTQTNNHDTALLLIGDPKQSIYGFRGADIYSYMRAREATAGRHYVLETNYRSTQALVNAVNHCFAHAERWRPEGGFLYRTPEHNPLPFESVRANGRAEQLVDAQGAVKPLTLVHDLQLRSNEEVTKVFAARCAEQIVTWLNDKQAGFSEVQAEGSTRHTALRPADIAVLVRTGKEAAAVRRELSRRLVASVYLSDKDSVLESAEAKDLVHWLRAIASPSDVRLVRAGLAIGIMGLSLDQLAWLASNDDAFDAQCEQLRLLRSIWQTQGVLAMLRQTLHQRGLAANWLSVPDGERTLTNFLHLAELLQTASSALDGEQALIRWLQTEIQAGGANNDEHIVRLESDADLVKVITIHKSKGLEYPIVCLPFATSVREKNRTNTSTITLANEAGELELHLQFSDAQLALADRERLREDLRLYYVALTRAQHALWVGFSAVKVGNNKACVTHLSGAGYLLAGTGAIEPQGWLDVLQNFAADCDGITLQAAEPDTACTALKKLGTAEALADAPLYAGDFERHWTIGSFSRLVKDLGAVQATSALSPLQIPRPADDEFMQDADLAPIKTDSASWHKFPRGAQTGNFLHDQLEWLAADHFALQANAALADRLRQRCEHAGKGDFAEGIVNWLTAVTHTRLPGPDAALADLHNILPEMEFWLPAERIETKEIDAQCRLHLLPGVERPALAKQQLHGMLMGFADLVFEHQGKFWVLDYKSNHLGNDDAAYGSEALAHSMAAHRYDVQAAIYMLALHRLLKSRLGDSYAPETHLGGAVYLYLRGIQGPQNGVCLIPPSLPLLTALDAMLTEEEQSA